MKNVLKPLILIAAALITAAAYFFALAQMMPSVDTLVSVGKTLSGKPPELPSAD